MAKPTLTPTDPPIEGSPEGSGAGALVVTILSWLITLAVIALIAYVANKLRARVVFFLGKDEQVLIEQLTDTEVVNGPGTKIVSPLVKRCANRRTLEHTATLSLHLTPLRWVFLRARAA